MPEPTATSPESENKPAAQPVTVDAEALGAAISKGIAKELSSRPALPEEPVVRPQPAPLPKEPTYDEIMDAIESGDKRKAAELMGQRDRAREARMDRDIIQPIREQGQRAASSFAKEAGRQYLADLPAKFHDEVRQLIKTNIEDNGVMTTADHWREAVALVRGRHSKELVDEEVETRLRQAREKPAGIQPGQGGAAEEEETEPTTLKEAFPGRFNEAFTTKARAKGGLSEDAEVAALNRGVKAARLMDDKGKPVREYTTKDYLRERREMREYIEQNPTLGLDE